MSNNPNDVIRHRCKCDADAWTKEVIYNSMRKYGCKPKTCPKCGSSMTCISETVIQHAD
jgi:tRNA splicing endonuclease